MAFLLDTLLKNAVLLLPDGTVCKDAEVGIRGGEIVSIADKGKSGETADTVDCGGNLLTPGFYNAHAHSPMTILRGYADDLKLQEWLNDYIFPREAHLDDRAVKAAAQLAIAECLRFGVTSVSDMYDHCDAICQAVAESGIKANISRGMTMFLGDEFDFEKFPACQELVALRDKWQGYDNGRIRIAFAENLVGIV